MAQACQPAHPMGTPAQPTLLQKEAAGGQGDDPPGGCPRVVLPRPTQWVFRHLLPHNALGTILSGTQEGQVLSGQGGAPAGWGQGLHPPPWTPCWLTSRASGCAERGPSSGWERWNLTLGDPSDQVCIHKGCLEVYKPLSHPELPPTFLTRS